MATCYDAMAYSCRLVAVVMQHIKVSVTTPVNTELLRDWLDGFTFLVVNVTLLSLLFLRVCVRS